MDRNEKFRRGLERKLNQPIKKELSARASNFDPTPYVNIVMDKFLEQDDEEVIEDFLKIFNENPDFEFIFGKSSVLNLTQKQKVLEEFMHRMTVLQDFDPEPYATELADLWGKPEFEQYKKAENEGEKVLNFDPYFEKHHFTREQKEIVFERFSDLMKSRVKKSRKTLLIPFFIACLLVIIPPFFIPNILQHMAWLSSDAGWLLKITIGIISGIVLFFIAKKLLSIVLNFLLKSRPEDE